MCISDTILKESTKCDPLKILKATKMVQVTRLIYIDYEK